MKKQLILSLAALAAILALPGCCCNDTSCPPEADEEVETVTVEAVGYAPADSSAKKASSQAAAPAQTRHKTNDGAKTGNAK